MQGRFFAVLVASVITLTACASDPAQLITADGIMADVEVLAADSMEGRSPGSVGEARATAYIAQRFEEVGLEPVGESYPLPVELVGVTKNGERSSLTIRGPSGILPYTNDETLTYWSTAGQETVSLRDVPIIFVGYGVEAPEYGWDDLKGEDLSGKVLLFLNNDPPVVENGEELFAGNGRTYYGRWTYKFEQAQKHGAAGAIMIHTTESASYGFSVIGNSGARQNWLRDYRLDFLSWIDSTSSERIAATMGTTLQGLFDMAAERDFRPRDTGYRITARIETEIERVLAHSVAGVLRGSDPELADQYLVFTAHHDHLGIDPNLEGEDKIYNGALDNALGVGAIISAAEAFIVARPRRSVMFVSVTAEEGGLLGSGIFVENPPVPRNQIVANFNVDSPQVFGLTNDVAAIGLHMNTLGAEFKAVAEEWGLEAKGDPNPAAGSFYRSDQVSFAKAGIPALYLQHGTEYVEELGFDPNEYQLRNYHQVTDEITPEWDLSGTARDMQVLFEAALRVANAEDMPRWVAGHEFEEEWRQLYER